jgi:hypothetical protein
MSSKVISDIEFLDHEVARREHFIYLYKETSALLRSKVRKHIEGFAKRSGWDRTNPQSSASLEKQLIVPSLFGETFIVCDAADFKVEDLKRALEGIAHGRFESHVLLMVSDRSRVLEDPVWREATERVGLIEEATVTIDNYRSVTRYLLGSSDLRDVQHFGKDVDFLSRMKDFVQDQMRSPFETAMQIDYIVLTQVKNGVLLDGDGDLVAERSEQRDLRLRLNQFLDDRSTATLHPLLSLVDTAVLSGNEAEWLLVRLFRASASVVAGRDRRYKRNREGNPAVLPYLVWGMLLLARERQFLDGNFLVAIEHLCQEYHSAATDPSSRFVGATNWQQIAIHLQTSVVDEPSNLDDAREELRSALTARIRELPNNVELSWLLPLVTNGHGKSGAVLEDAWSCP